jgi:hypothetical protein
MSQRVFFLNTLRDGVERADYEEWIRRVDYPVARRQPSIQNYVVTRLEGRLDGDAPPPYQYLEVIEITDIDEYRQDMSGNPEFEALLSEWSRYVGESIAVYGENIE